ncbi:bifunctional demethylmenaquinone methyltransferase/2-methoxy-6-polyprenyl-1,4-benzoquinol methylase UbiE [Sulfurospirillum sp. T05]|uniref:Demethylmenaquinone methyltransferase n=1 Tax=Sulfurospirillum tamanense TaxID=2813362 RepID=A0ABS2WP47_9BACT|nr:bifunctional demethylmenaquinone methyltransferase/2-methoxy-6-polyprenyl-1,4-benzoquinol methylase UbiE [Sulfurospirillum tamanensis]MBN2963461.1 bifunctional demethylmenaquinone methyltransferase/2-methoxy-6-polyprenyl-1,4-benzoquinol methylase UbiE [Sulfurospirillum tamanensis]
MKSEEKQQEIVDMFNTIAPTYDKANRILSMGVDISWRKKACDLAFEFYPKNPLSRIVDVACGTGDMMGFWQKQADKKGIKVKKMVGVDPSSGMLAVGKEKFPSYEFILSKATDIPLETNSADVLSISYGIRNVVEREAAFVEFARVVKPGGLVVILEFTKDDKKGPLHALKQWYLTKLLPRIGGMISKNRAAYEYLPNSIEGFLTASMMQEELKNAGFETVHCESFSMDISTLIIAKRV